MKSSKLTKLVLAFFWNIVIVFLTLGLPEFSPVIHTYGQTENKVRTIRSEFVPEAGCPVSVEGLRTDLDVDPFDAPLDARIYIEYKNIGPKPISAVKFRLRFVDDSGNNVGTFQASDGVLLAPQQQSSQKFKQDKIEPHSTSLMLRVLMVKYVDGEIWESAKAPLVPKP
ncbi:MAG: hypothetical protein EKK48_20305 [Candidatus Melainabacteria bacterium]|nr:MAG: hypothetical protein EKK48_20305 [Candidatus Melainabacteria bacterium]